LVLFVGILSGASARAQGGPPMLTDDPGTPGNGHLETNVAVTVEHGAHNQSWELPVLDLNYGVGERIQLNLQTSMVLLKRDDHGPIGGWGDTSAAVKWRFLDEERNGVSLSVFPRLEWNSLRSSVRRGLVEDGTRLLLPVEIARGFGLVDLDAEAGVLLNSVGRSEWIYGIVAGVPVTSTTNVMVELHGNARTNLTLDRLSLNAGLRQKLTSSVFLITSAGRDLRSAPGERLSFIGYFGVQLVY
jgi:hypothetical protein